MFKKARLKLTFWYVVIIMIVSLLFSGLAYRGLIFEVRRGLRVREFRPREEENFLREFVIPISPSVDLHEKDIEIFEEVRKRVIIRLLAINFGVLFFSAFVAYFLSGRTLHSIEEMLEDQKRFIADASHELRTPLTAMKTEIEVSLRDKKMTIFQAKKMLASNLEEVDRMQFLSNHLLDLSKYQSNKLKFDRKSVDLEQIIDNSINNVEVFAKEKQIIFRKKLGKDVIVGDFVSLVELFTILFDNAVKYSHDKGEVIISSIKKQGKIEIIVEDFGVGIKKEDISHIFDRFYRADFSRSKNKIDGFGLGLSIAKSIADLHEGKIEVDSVVGVGSKFKVILR